MREKIINAIKRKISFAKLQTEMSEEYIRGYIDALNEIKNII